MASSGVIFILIQASDKAKFKLELGADPGLKSEAIANGKPLSMIFLAGVYGIYKNKEHKGKATGMVVELAKESISESVNTSKWSTLKALFFIADSIPPMPLN